MSWDRYELGQKNIFYDDKIRIFASSTISSHVRQVQELILDFSCAVNGTTIDADGVLNENAISALLGGPDPDPVLKDAQMVQWEARSIVNGGYKEDRWANFFVNNFFAKLSDSLTPTKEDSRRYTDPLLRSKPWLTVFNQRFAEQVFLRRHEKESDELWDLFDDDSADHLGPFEKLKRPKPDHAFFLPIYHIDAGARIPSIMNPEARQWNQILNPKAVEPFSWATLQELNEYGLQPAPFRIFNKAPVEARLKCYPWFVVEHKKEGEQKRNVSCQAANAAACALRLVRQAARYAVELLDEAHIPPIPVMTSIGSRVTIWITFFGRDFDAPCEQKYRSEVTIKRRKEGYLMYAIWSGDMVNLVDIVKFQTILENIHTWAMRMFKPLMSTYIEQWKYVHCRNGLSSGALLLQSQEKRKRTVEQRRAVVPIVKSLLDDEAATGLDDISNQKITPLFLGLLMHQVCLSQREQIAQQVERAIEDRVAKLGIALGTETSSVDRVGSKSTSIYFGPTASIFKSSPATQFTPVDDDDPNDPDWQESQHLSVASANLAHHAATEVSDAEGSLPSKSDGEFAQGYSPLWRASSDAETPHSEPTRSQVPERPGSPDVGSTPRPQRSKSSSDKHTPVVEGYKFLSSPVSTTESLGSTLWPPGWTVNFAARSKAMPDKHAFSGGSPAGESVWDPRQQSGKIEFTSSPLPRQSRQRSDDVAQARSSQTNDHSVVDLTIESQEEEEVII